MASNKEYTHGVSEYTMYSVFDSKLSVCVNLTKCTIEGVLINVLSPTWCLSLVGKSCIVKDAYTDSVWRISRTSNVVELYRYINDNGRHSVSMHLNSLEDIKAPPRMGSRDSIWANVCKEHDSKSGRTMVDRSQFSTQQCHILLLAPPSTTVNFVGYWYYYLSLRFRLFLKHIYSTVQNLDEGRQLLLWNNKRFYSAVKIMASFIDSSCVSKHTSRTVLASSDISFSAISHHHWHTYTVHHVWSIVVEMPKAA